MTSVNHSDEGTVCQGCWTCVQKLLMAAESGLLESFMTLWSFLRLCPLCFGIHENANGKKWMAQAVNLSVLHFQSTWGEWQMASKSKCWHCPSQLFSYHWLNWQPQRHTQLFPVSHSWGLMLTRASLALPIVPTASETISLPEKNWDWTVS